MTPEGRVKAAVNKVLDRPGIYRFMPVPGGYGKKTLDYLVCAFGVFVAIETKAPGKKPTALQERAIADIREAGGRVFVIDDAKDVGELQEFINDLAGHHQQETSGGRRPA